MTAKQFKDQYQADPSMTRTVTTIVVEVAEDGYLLAMATGPAGVAYCASCTSSKAMGRACSAAAFGEYAAAEAFETPDEALEYARTSTRDWH